MKCKDCKWKRRCRNQCRLLPEGRNCGQCARLVWCKAMYGIEASNTMCVVAPPKFEEGGQDE